MIRATLLSWLVLLAGAATTPAGFAQEPEGQACYAIEGQDVCISQDSYRSDVCSALSFYAQRWNLPADFFARLIWQESRFDPAALSPAGAEGIAQFMPGTARLRNLGNPFNPAEALARSAEYLRFLEGKFGNLGLAAAAYNGGEGRISRYVSAGGGPLPAETRAYVMIVTGHSVDTWLANPPQEVSFTLAEGVDFHAACLDMARSVSVPNLVASPAEWQPWGVLIAQNASADVARMRFDRAKAEFSAVLGAEELMLISARNPAFGNSMRFSAMIGRQTRGEANQLCQQLLAAGGNCIVQKNAP
ncbi:MAG TPA: lytic transglycosylase domain-containing protein [Devosia sp.]|uniref:lytic transglycosylase domain-containing protein n=1 Tax=Devosia sp. TaxID=1871048 RepID=UPI002F9498D5